MSTHSDCCPRCGTPLADNSGFETHGVQHGLCHGLLRGDPIMLGLAALGAAGRLLYPRKLTCPRCAYSVKR